MTTLGHELFGTGPAHAIVMNDWLCDTSTWDTARPYLDTRRATWAFADLRGYGRSQWLKGKYTLAEAAADVTALAESLGWSRFVIVGHSMSSLVALHLAQTSDHVERAVLISPPPPGGFGADADSVAKYQASIGDDAESRYQGMKARWGDRLSEAWVRFKAERWVATSAKEAVVAYYAMFAGRGVPDPTMKVAIPVLAITGEHDAPPMRREAVMAALSPLCAALTVRALTDSGHYPMQECPPLTATWVNRFVVR